MHNKKININKTKNFAQGLRPFSTVIPSNLKKILKKSGYNFSNIIDKWTKMVGKDVSDISYPITIKTSAKMREGTLILNVIHGKQLEIEYKKQLIIDKINSFFGYKCVSQIKLKVIFKDELKNKKNSDFNFVNKFQKKIKLLKNQDLQKSLSRLIKAYGEKKV